MNHKIKDACLGKIKIQIYNFVFQSSAVGTVQRNTCVALQELPTSKSRNPFQFKIMRFCHISIQNNEILSYFNSKWWEFVIFQFKIMRVCHIPPPLLHELQLAPKIFHRPVQWRKSLKDCIFRFGFWSRCIFVCLLQFFKDIAVVVNYQRLAGSSCEYYVMKDINLQTCNNFFHLWSIIAIKNLGCLGWCIHVHFHVYVYNIIGLKNILHKTY